MGKQCSRLPQEEIPDYHTRSVFCNVSRYIGISNYKLLWCVGTNVWYLSRKEDADQVPLSHDGWSIQQWMQQINPLIATRLNECSNSIPWLQQRLGRIRVWRYCSPKRQLGYTAQVLSFPGKTIHGFLTNNNSAQEVQPWLTRL